VGGVLDSIQPRSKSIEAFGNCLGPYCRTLRRNSRQGKIQQKKKKKQTKKDPPSLTIFHSWQLFNDNDNFVKSGVNNRKAKMPWQLILSCISLILHHALVFMVHVIY
jgi:hypothetical protein